MSDSNSNIVDPNTDDLDAFDSLFHGHGSEVKASEEAATSEDEIVEDNATESEDVDTLETEDDETEGGSEDDSENEDSEKDDLDPEPEPDPKPKKSRAQERIDELTREKYEERRQRIALEEKLDAILAKVAPPEKETETAAPEVSGPQPNDSNEDGTDKYPLGEFDPAYIRDLTRYTIEQERETARVAAEERSRVEAEEAARVQLATEWTGKLEEATERYPDLHEKNVALVDYFSELEPAYGEYLASTIMSMENGPDVLYYLANNLDEARAIVASGATKATLTLGRLEARFAKDAETEVRKPKLSKAPTPPPQINKGAASVSTIAPDTDDLDAFETLLFKKK